MEGFLPLFGAATLYLGLGLGSVVATSTFKFGWWGWIDPLGWLYGVVILAAQCGWRSWLFREPLRLTVYCCAIGAGSVGLLMIAMLSRGKTPDWQPPFSLNIASALLASAMLYVGYCVSLGAPPGR